MRFLSPEWLIFVPLLIASGWYWKRMQLWKPLRVLILSVLVLILIRPEIRHLGEGLDLWLLVDRSASAEDLLQPRLPELRKVLERSKRKTDRIHFVDFADVAIVRGENDEVIFDGSTLHTRSALAVRHALSQMPANRAARILLLSDGYSTEPLNDLAERLVSQQVPLDYRLLVEDESGDVRVAGVTLPTRVQVAEPYLVTVELAGTADQAVPYTIFRDGIQGGSGTVNVLAGQGEIRFTDRLSQPGGHRYQVQIAPVIDSHPGNNIGEAWIEVVAGPRVLIISGYEPDPMAASLRRQGFDVQVVRDPRTLHDGMLSGARAVLFNNVPAHRIPSPFLKSLDFFVRVQGGGLFMAGGQFSFGSGGYFESPVDPLLPVSMDLREEHRKLSVAMAIVMDRSGSMGAGVPGGGAGTTKMDLANEGSARVIELLGTQDAVTVFAVDSTAHEILPLTTLGKEKGKLIETVRRVQSMGGGIFVYNGLKAGWEQLRNANVGQRHLILFSDAADSEQPDDYKNLVAEMVAQGTSISVIGLGTENDSDAEFLKDIAKRGNGRIFFNRNPADLPALFAQEAVAVARSAFIEDPVTVEDAGGWLELAARPMDWMPEVDGYNLSYLRPEATAACVSGDEYHGPLVAFWQRGLGRSAAVSFPLGGDSSEKVRAWSSYGDFLQTLARWLMGDDVPPGVAIKTNLDGTLLTLELLYDDRWEDRVAQSAPAIIVQQGEDKAVEEHVWERLEPGHFRSAIHLEPLQKVRGAVQIGQAVIPFGPITAGLNAEWTFDRRRIEELQEVARVSGGSERLELSTIWEAPRRTGFRDARPWFYVALLVLVLLDALVTRMGWGVPKFRWVPTPALPRAKPTRPARTRAKRPDPEEADPPVVPAEAPEDPSAEQDAEQRKSRFKRAKRR